MQADILTKGLGASKHNSCKTALGMRPVDQRLTN